MMLNYPSSSACRSDELYRSQNTPDELDEFLSQITCDIPGISSIPAPAPTHPSAATPPLPQPAPTTPTALAAEPVPFSDPLPFLMCDWVTQHNPLAMCGAALSPDPKETCTHFRLAHNIRGNDKVTVECHWYACRAAPMQRGSLIRHILAVHLGILRWQCEACGKVFSRKGTTHLCDGEVGI